MTEYDKLVLLLVFGLTAITDALLVVLIVIFGISWSWSALPVGWLVGALMTWGFGKYKDGPVAQR